MLVCVGITNDIEFYEVLHCTYTTWYRFVYKWICLTKIIASDKWMVWWYTKEHKKCDDFFKVFQVFENEK